MKIVARRDDFLGVLETRRETQRSPPSRNPFCSWFPRRRGVGGEFVFLRVFSAALRLRGESFGLRLCRAKPPRLGGEPVFSLHHQLLVSGTTTSAGAMALR
jgi:hypothetical protein